MLKIPVRAWLLALLSSGLQVIIFPKLSVYWLCWVAILPLLYALLRGHGGQAELIDSEGRSLRPFTLRQGFLLSWACGVVWWAGTCYWVYPVFHSFGNLSAFAALLVTALLVLTMGLHHGVFGLLVVMMARRATVGNRRPLLLAPFFWVAIELFRDRVIGFPWNPLGNAQIDNVPFARISAFTGVYGLSFAIMLVNCAFAAAVLLRGARRKDLLIASFAAAIALQLGVLTAPAPVVSTKQAVLVQQNVPVLDSVWSQAYYDRTLFELSQITVQAAHQASLAAPALIIWPESPAPFYTNDDKFLHWLAAMAQDTHAHLIVGSTGVTASASGERLPLNSALVVDPQGKIVGSYDKIHLVPFGEYVPFKDLLSFAKKLTHEVGEFGRGTERKVFDLNGVRVGAFICYESSFPDEVREFAAGGAEVLVNISNDGWYGDTSAPYQHLDMARMRAIENDRWVLVATNTGITVSIDPYGRVVKRAERNERTALVAPFGTRAETTFYTRNGDLFAWICVVISLVAVFLRIRIPARTMAEAEVRPA
ncbi:MAG TPA: apolipoprotein N-acyltransferase [Candidatus Saccharimonadales bacterium]|nr:apolipoprotein N-acyltransferase [Candidatus Saccharimonadales bacterium]